ncbi:methyl-accepting chemotaxis protein [Halomonas sp. 328]|uniref:methyl-accepting chemotaxis protein n=1 Tax=Halomonas sp. 328 TaxID=2776704 RepID=UPI0018A7ABF0|nr:methyl-accepting chemotaxis protein [Halomonas sp. 328]MBF8223305.1 Tar ligand binding domain-containing protein [Halomonas sp. 328]
MTLLDRLSLRHLARLLLLSIALLVGALTLFALQVTQQSRTQLIELERVNVQQASSLSRLQVAALEGLTRMDRALERQLRPSLGDPEAALEAIERELAIMAAAQAQFMAAPYDAAQADIRQQLAAHYEQLDEAMRAQRDAILRGDRAAYRALTHEAMAASHALHAEAHRFHEDADRRVADLMRRADAQARLATLGLTLGLGLAALLLAGVAVFGQRRVLGPLREVIAHFQHISAGDLSRPIASRGRHEIGQLFAELARMQAALADMAVGVRTGGERVLTHAQQASLGNRALAGHTQQQASALEQTAAGLDQLTATVAHNAEHANQAASLSACASQRAREGSDQVVQCVATMQAIRDESGRIAEIITLIDAIAFQTNILALNASVEAARAGEQGRGFAVVAGEVRALAARSATAAEDIRRLIERSLSRIESGTELTARAGDGMRAIVTAVDEVSTLLEGISQASREQHDGIVQLNQAMRQMEGVTRQYQERALQANEAAQTLEQEARELDTLASGFTLAEPKVRRQPEASPTRPARIPRRPASPIPSLEGAC